MRSKRSCFNPAFARLLLKRFWPLWLLWLAALLLVGPVNVLSVRESYYDPSGSWLNSLTMTLLESGRGLAFCGIVAGPAMAMAMLSYLYNPRVCGLVNTLPLRRETAYCTAVLTGLVPMAAADVLVYLILSSRLRGMAGFESAHLTRWLAMVALSNVAFYGFACFCGVLTGHVLVLPAVYAVLGCTAVVAESAARALLGVLVYGYTWDELLLDKLSPIVYVLGNLSVVSRWSADGRAVTAYEVRGLGYLVWIAAAGLALAAAAVLILKKRHMESAGEIVAVPVLRPIFRVCMAVGCGLVGATLGSEEYFERFLHGAGLSAAVLVLLVLCAAVGYFAAQMLIRRTLRVFRSGWRELGAICACLVLLAVLADRDVLGYETRTPDPAEVVSVRLYMDGRELTEPESIAAYGEFHRLLIERKPEIESRGTRNAWHLTLNWALRDGTRFSRLYDIPYDEAAFADPASPAAAYERLNNLPEAIRGRVAAERGFGAEEILYAAVELSLPDAAGRWTGQDVQLSPEQALSLYREGILPDAQAGNIARWYGFESDEARAMQTNCSVTLELIRRETLSEQGRAVYDPGSWIGVTVLECSENTLRWLEENLGVTPQNQYALEQANPRIRA